MNLLVTAGNTQSPIDRVRCITNIFSGRTGARIAAAAFDRGHRVRLLTSHPNALAEMPALRPRVEPNWQVVPYRTFEDLEGAMAESLTSGTFDAVVHAAAVNDYHVVGTYAKQGESMVDVSAGKVKGHHPELWLRLVPAAKLVDKIRRDWHFRGTLVKFKLEVDVTDEQLLAVAEGSRVHSAADLMCANTLDGMHDWAYLGAGTYDRIPRTDLAADIVRRLEVASNNSQPLIPKLTWERDEAVRRAMANPDDTIDLEDLFDQLGREDEG